MSIKEYAKRKLRAYAKSEAERRAYRKILKKKAQQAKRQAYAKSYVEASRKKATKKARADVNAPSFFSMPKPSKAKRSKRKHPFDDADAVLRNMGF